MFIMDFLLALFLVISVLAKRLAGKSVSDMTYVVSSGTLNLNSVGCFFSIHIYLVFVQIAAGRTSWLLECVQRTVQNHNWGRRADFVAGEWLTVSHWYAFTSFIQSIAFSGSTLLVVVGCQKDDIRRTILPLTFTFSSGRTLSSAEAPIWPSAQPKAP